MNILRKGSTGTEVSQLQKILVEKGFSVKPDGVFGDNTHLAVCQFQKSANLTADGIVGQVTWNALLGNKSGQNTASPKKETSEKNELDFRKAAELLGVEEAAIRAVHQVESGGRKGFLPDGRPMILFEGHIFWNQLKKVGINPENHVQSNEDILFPRRDRTSYKSGTAEHNRLERAMKIHREAALNSASWGMFQIMGFNHKLCGYNTVTEYVKAMEANSSNQLIAFVNFLKNSKFDAPLKQLDWAGFAAKYNGPAYKDYRYDEKLEAAYKKYKNV